jgi:thiamine monophosphate synthase
MPAAEAEFLWREKPVPADGWIFWAGRERRSERSCASAAHLVRGGVEALVLRDHQDDDEDHVHLTGPQLLGGAECSQQRDKQGVWI